MYSVRPHTQVVTGILKYVPQVVLNIRRRSTTGWTIWNVILDFTGGLLSVVQVFIADTDRFCIPFALALLQSGHLFLGQTIPHYLYLYG